VELRLTSVPAVAVKQGELPIRIMSGRIGYVAGLFKKLGSC